MSTPDYVSLLQGKRVLRVRRILYVYKGSPPEEHGPIELKLNDGSVVWFTAASDGERLAIHEGEWIDAFAPPLSPENAEYVNDVGKWTAFDLSAEHPYEQLVESEILAVLPILNPRDRLIGLEVLYDSNSLRLEVVADDLAVNVL